MAIDDDDDDDDDELPEVLQPSLTNHEVPEFQGDGSSEDDDSFLETSAASVKNNDKLPEFLEVNHEVPEFHYHHLEQQLEEQGVHHEDEGVQDHYNEAEEESKQPNDISNHSRLLEDKGGVGEAFGLETNDGLISEDNKSSRVEELRILEPDQMDELNSLFTCPICGEILFKPTVLQCGHHACFWCLYKWMKERPYSSQCFMCRTKFTNFPGICEVLNNIVVNTLPIESATRSKAVLLEEKDKNLFSGEVNVSTNSLNQMLKCPVCRKIFVQPTTLTCGHVFCSSCIKAPVNKWIICPICSHYNQPRALHPSVSIVLQKLIDLVFPHQETPNKSNPEVEREVEYAYELDTQEVQLQKHMRMCNLCGEFPIMGDRFKCLDCSKSIPCFKYNLCERCFFTSSKERFERFKSEHDEHHEFDVVPPIRTIERDQIEDTLGDRVGEMVEAESTDEEDEDDADLR